MGEDAWTASATRRRACRHGRSARRSHATRARGACRRRFLDVDQHGRPVPSRAGDGAEFDALFDVLSAVGRGLVEIVPAAARHRRPVPADGGLRPRLRRARHPAHLDRRSPTPTGTRAPPRSGSTWRGGCAARASEFYPQLSPRTVDFRLNWDSSMMFMSMPEGWHKVIAARGPAKAALLRDPEWRAAARGEWDRTERAMFPHRGLRPCGSSRSVGAENEQWLGRTLAELGRRARRASLRRARRLRARQRLPSPASSPLGIANADVEGVARTLADPDGAHQLVRRRRPHADAVRVGRHHAAAHPPRPRTRRLHRSSRRSTS